MNVRKISVAPLEPQSAIVPKNANITKKKQSITNEPKVSSSDLETIRDSVLPAKPVPKQTQVQVQVIKEDKGPIIQQHQQQKQQQQNVASNNIPVEPPPMHVTKTRKVKIVENEGTADQYEADVEVGTMFRRVDGHIEETLHEEAFIKKTLMITTAVAMSSLSGILLILIGFAQSEAFQNIEPNIGVVCVGFFLQIPVFYWIYRKIYPPNVDVETKRRLRKNRHYRSRALEKDDIKYIEDTNEEDRRYYENEKLTMKKKYVYDQQNKLRNPLGYPTLGATRHKWDDS